MTRIVSLYFCFCVLQCISPKTRGNTKTIIFTGAHMWGAKVNKPNDMSMDQLKATIQKATEVLSTLESGFEPTMEMSKELKLWLDKEYGAGWLVCMGRNFGSECVRK